MEIFLIEATEVLDKVLENRAELARNLGDREALRSARRQFHTIKGSGRMVGLNELGELAYDVEKIHNRLLEEERAVTPAMLHLLDVAEANFRRWVGALQDKGDVYADPAELYAAIGAVEAELPSEFESGARPPAPSLPSVVPAAVAPVEPAAPVEAEVPDADLVPEPEPIVAAAAAEPVAWIESAEEDEEAGAEIIEFAPVGEMPAGAMRTTARRRRPTSSRSATCRCRPNSTRSSSTRRAVISRRSTASFAAAIRSATGAVRRNGAGEPYALRHPSGRWLPADCADGPGTGALSDRAAAAAVPLADGGAAGARRCRGRASGIPRARQVERRSFNATDVAIAAEIQQELEAVRQSALAAPAAFGEMPGGGEPAKTTATEFVPAVARSGRAAVIGGDRPDPPRAESGRAGGGGDGRARW